MKKYIVLGISAGILLFAAYALLLYFLNGFGHLVEQIREYWFLIFLLVSGFGFQISLFFFARNALKEKASKTVAAPAASASSMIVCCLHHITDVLPTIGLSGLFLFLADYTFFFLLLGVFSNFVGILFMFSMLQKHSLLPASISKISWNEARNAGTAFSIVVVSIAFSLSLFSLPSNAISADSSQTVLQTLSDSQNNVTVSATPLLSNNGVSFNISFDTHSVDLGFRAEEIAVLKDSVGTFKPVSWSGGKGGHHIQGTLYFSETPSSDFSLTLSGIAGIDRKFEWSMK